MGGAPWPPLFAIYDVKNKQRGAVTEDSPHRPTSVVVRSGGPMFVRGIT